MCEFLASPLCLQVEAGYLALSWPKEYGGQALISRVKRALGGNLAPEVHWKTRLLGFKGEFGRFLSAHILGGGLSFSMRQVFDP
jgi:alkylation response protein AidB-like acyl-CoA dehydrogenase